jgi:hypothetical protein
MRKFSHSFLIFPQRFFGEGDGATTAGTSTGSGTITITAPGNVVPSGVELPPEFTGKTSFTQEEMNRIFAHNKRKLQQTSEQQAQRLEELRNNQNLTQQQRDSLAQEIEQLRAQHQTKEQQASQELNREKERYNKDTKTLKEERDAWKGRFETTTVRHDIAKAAENHKAFRASQIEAILLPLTKVVEEVEGGNPTGRFRAQVDFPSFDKDKKPITLKVTPDEAVKLMKEDPDNYGNLFVNDAAGGTGGMPSPGQQGKALNVGDMSIEQYRKNRQAVLTRSR